MKISNVIFQKLGIVLAGCGLFLGCEMVSACSGRTGSSASVDRNEFNKYWYAGKAEITRYALQQARYGEIRKGDAVLIFVTEDFLTDKQVKHESGDSKASASVLKLNFTRKFYTGIYPYSMMTSVFTPVDFNKYATLKVTSTSQEWCGHTFLQLNNRKNKIHVQLRSYFQSEGDQNFEIDPAFLEDEVWTRIRLAPEALPTGKVEMIPGTQFSRFRHTPLQAETTTAALTTTRDKNLSPDELHVYTIEYPRLKRKLAITFEKQFPHRILAWEASHPSGFGPNAKILTTRAVKTHSLLTDYWSKNKLSDSHLRDELGLIY
ncbi:MAG: septum formation inhibitor Maf [bacterium]